MRKKFCILASDDDIDAIVAGTYVEDDDDDTAGIATDGEIDAIVAEAFK